MSVCASVCRTAWLTEKRGRERKKERLKEKRKKPVVDFHRLASSCFFFFIWHCRESRIPCTFLSTLPTFVSPAALLGQLDHCE